MDEGNTIRVVLVEDSSVLTERLREMLAQLIGVELVGAVDTEKAAVALVGKGDIDALILDLHLKQGTGFGVLRALRNTPRKPEAIVLTNYALPQYQREAQALGVRHFLDKAREFHRLPELLRDIADAKRHTSTH